MGDIRRPRKKYQTPSHPWEMARLEEEKPLLKDYELRNKKEIWKMHSTARTIASQAKNLIAKREDAQSKKEKELLMSRLIKYNLIRQGDPIEAALALTTKDILERRLQTLVFRKNLARSMNQARQLVTHKHIMVNKKVITSPAYLVSADEENQIEYAENSPFADQAHPERPEVKVQMKIEEEKEKIKPKENAE
jgi:small subunit ribosomal protein S4